MRKSLDGYNQQIVKHLLFLTFSNNANYNCRIKIKHKCLPNSFFCDQNSSVNYSQAHDSTNNDHKSSRLQSPNNNAIV